MISFREYLNEMGRDKYEKIRDHLATKKIPDTAAAAAEKSTDYFKTSGNTVVGLDPKTKEPIYDKHNNSSETLIKKLKRHIKNYSTAAKKAS